MPKIKITELDLTTAATSSIDAIVFIPIEVAEEDTFGPTLFLTAGAFEAAVPEAESSEGTDAGWTMVKQLLGAGMQVLVQGVTALTEVDWTKTGLADKSLYDVRFLTAGAFEHTDGVDSEGRPIDDGTNGDMIDCAKTRGDCIALVDHPKALTDAEDIKAYAGTPTNGEFGAMFAPWCNFTFNAEEFTLPGSFAFLMAYAASTVNNPSWFAVAGAARGRVPGLDKPLVDFGSAAIDVLQSRTAELDEEGDNVGIAINPIAPVRPFGYIIWGNRTLKNNEGTTALSFLNVRNLVCELKKVLYRAARSLTFEQNSDVLWVKFTSLVYPTLDRMTSGNGISGYKILKLTTDARARLKATVRIFPIEAVEDFELSVVLEDEAATVTE